MERLKNAVYLSVNMLYFFQKEGFIYVIKCFVFFGRPLQALFFDEHLAYYLLRAAASLAFRASLCAFSFSLSLFW